MRWAVKGRGKRGGARAIYYVLRADGALLMVQVYTKAVQANVLPKDIKRK